MRAHPVRTVSLVGIALLAVAALLLSPETPGRWIEGVAGVVPVAGGAGDGTPTGGRGPVPGPGRLPGYGGGAASGSGGPGRGERGGLAGSGHGERGGLEGSGRGEPGGLPGAAATLPEVSQAGYEELRDRAETLFAEGSYGRALELYRQADAMELSASDRRWVELRLADARWRARAGSSTADPTAFEEARAALEELIRQVRREEDRDRVWAEAHESLGDLFWARREARDWGSAWPHYQAALEWWAGSTDLDRARGRYLGIVWTIAEPPGRDRSYVYGSRGNYLPLEVLDDVLEIVTTDADRARAHFLAAMSLRAQGGSWEAQRRMVEEFEAAIEASPGTGWRDDALYHLADWLDRRGRPVATAAGQWTAVPDHAGALERFRQLVAEYRDGESAYRDEAERRIAEITGPTVSVATSNIFLPGSRVELHVAWRNVAELELRLVLIDLDRAPDLARDRERSSHEWLETVDLSSGQVVRAWSVPTGDTGEHRPGQRVLRLEDELPAGAYVVEVVDAAAASVLGPVRRALGTAAPRAARDLVLVTEAALVLKTAGDQALVYFCNALDGAPLPGARIVLWERDRPSGDWRWRRLTATADDDGIAVFDLSGSSNSTRDLFVAGVAGDQQAFSTGSAHDPDRSGDPWRVYAFTDRAAYRPGDEVRWKVIARRHDGSVYSTPAGQTVRYVIQDPRGTRVEEREVHLNAFGSAWGELEVDASMPLGEYRVSFRDGASGRHIGQATLFRLEEYRLPEYTVTVATPRDDAGRLRAFRLGERVEAEVRAEYTFGGAVAGASVEVLVYQRPFQYRWRPRRAYGWYYEDIDGRWPRAGYGGEQLVQRELLSTDADGRAVVAFDTQGAGQDLEYRIEARVTDASRREIVGSGRVRVTRQRYHVTARPRHHVLRPGDRVEVDLHARDANDQPVATSGTVTVTRDTWREVWVDVDGNEVSGRALEELRRRNPTFPLAGGTIWQLRSRGYEHDEVLTRTVGTDEAGDGEIAFTAGGEGYYSVSFASSEDDAPPITASTTVWVATGATTELGYRHGGLGVIVDRDTFAPGQRAPVMLVTPSSDRWVLFSVEGESLRSWRLVHVTGTAKLVEIDIGDEHVPNVWLAGAMVADRQLWVDARQVVVPPLEHFLEVELESDRDVFQPGDEGNLTVRVRDHEGNPVAAEVALGLVDESTFHIQQEYAADPRQHFFGTRRVHRVRTTSTFQHRRYAELVEGADGRLVERRQLELESLADLGALGGQERREYDRISGARADELAAAKAATGYRSRGLVVAEMAAAPMPASDAAAAPSQEPAGQQPAVQVRSDFRSTVLWLPDVVTGADGTATLPVTYPDSLTTWRATARAATTGSRFGLATASTRTRKPLIVRLQAPRFLVVGDTATVSAVVNNNTDGPLSVTPELQASGVEIVGDGPVPAASRNVAVPVIVPARGERRVDWRVAVVDPGAVHLAVTGRGGGHDDGMERSLVAHDHGIEKLVSASGKVRADDVSVHLDLPAARRPGSTRLEVQVTPSVAVTMLDALPYLIDYPYGCTEQTMSRFLPTVITAGTLADLGLDRAAVVGRAFGGVEPDFAGATHPGGAEDLARLDEMVRQGLDRLYDFQHADGGWGWWKEGDSDHFMSAYVVWGLTLARDAGVELRGDALVRGVRYLELEIVEAERAPDLQAWMLHALSTFSESMDRQGRAYPWEFPLQRTFDNLWGRRDGLNAYTRALLALSAHHLGLDEEARVLVRNLENGVQRDDAPDTSIVQRGGGASSAAVMATAHWGEDGLWWRWSDGGVEATSFALRALLAIDPGNDLVEPVMNWLVKNRRGAQWSNTRDTAITVLALNDYLRTSGELATDLEYELWVNGTRVTSRRITPDDILRASSRFAIDDELVADGDNEVRIVRRSGEGPLYFAAAATFFSLEEPVTPAGNEIFVRRQYVELVPRETLLNGTVYQRVPLGDGDTLVSGQRVEAILTIEAKNEYEYLLFEDLKPAGLETVRIRSGEPLFAAELRPGAVEDRLPGDAGSGRLDGTAERADTTGRRRRVYQELRDRRVAMFVDRLPEGFWEIRYELRAEVPGEFHALPLMGHAMYVPEIRASGQEVRITVEDRR